MHARKKINLIQYKMVGIWTFENMVSLARLQRLLKEVSLLKTTSNVPTYLPVETLEICSEPWDMNLGML
jgi:hypothetical protein